MISLLLSKLGISILPTLLPCQPLLHQVCHLGDIVQPELRDGDIQRGVGDDGDGLVRVTDKFGTHFPADDLDAVLASLFVSLHQDEIDSRYILVEGYKQAGKDSIE